MKRLPFIHCATALAAGLAAISPAQAAITKIVCSPSDYTCQAFSGVNNTAASTTDAIGFAGNNSSWCAILMFPLPTLPAGQVIGNQTTLTVTLTSVGASTTVNGDLWGVANFRNTIPAANAAPDSTYYYYLNADAGPGANSTATDTKLVDNFLTPALKTNFVANEAVTTALGATNTLQNYIQSFYSANTNYDASVSQAYVWLRINLDGPSGNTGIRYIINAGDTGVSSALRPTLNLDMGAPPAAAPVVWSGSVSPVWDVNTTANWTSNGIVSMTYQNGDGVLFDDTLSANPAITLNTIVSPASVTFNNSVTNYILGGTGKITGTNGLTKLGTKTAIIDINNDYSGVTSLGNGILQIGNNDTNGSIGTNSVLVTSTGLTTLAFNRTDSITNGTIANGGGNPNVAINSGIVTFAGATDNIGAGVTVNSAATLILGKPSSGAVHALGVSSTINAGGTMQLGGMGGDQIYQNVIITNNGTFDLAGHGEGFNGLIGTGLVTNSIATNSTLALGDGNGTANFAGSIVTGTGTISVTKTGTGVETLSGSNNYTGDTHVNAGELVVTSASTGGGAYFTADAATLGIAADTNGGVLNIGALSTGASKLEFQNLFSTNIAPINVGTLTLSNTVVINITGGNFTPNQEYPLISYGTLPNGANFSLGTLPPGVFANLDTSGNPIKLQITSTTLTWNGNVNGDWDVMGTANWKVGALTNLTYPDGEIVVFDDTLAGTPIVNLTTTVSPAYVLFTNNTTSYTLTSSDGGTITGPTTFLKAGSGTLIIDTDNDYYGGTALAGGTLQVGNNDTHGTLGFGAFTNLGIGSHVVFDRTDSITVGNITRTTVDNSASLVINSGVVTLGGTGDNSGTGATVNSGATLILGKTSSSAVHALSSTTNILIQPGGLLQLAGTGNDQIYTASVVTDNGIFDLAGHNEGFDQLYGSGMVSNSSGSAATLQLGENNGSSTFTGAIINGAGTVAFTKIGTGTITASGADSYTGDTTVSAGELVVSTAGTGAGNYITANAATLGVSVAAANGSLAVGAVTLGSSAASTLEFQSVNSTTAAALNATSLTVNGPVSINITSASFAVGQTYPLLAYGSISGSGSFAIKNLPAGVSGTLNTGASPISFTVTSVISKTPPTLAASYNSAAGTLSFQWPVDHTGYTLQSNSVSLLNTNAWQPVAGSTNTNSVTLTINTNLPQVFYRLKY